MIEEIKREYKLCYKYFPNIPNMCDWFNSNPQYDFINFDKVSDSMYSNNICAVYKEYVK